MAALSITPTNVVLDFSTASVKRDKNAGETITAGQAVCWDADNKVYMLADNNDADKYQAVGIALHGAHNGSPLAIVENADDLDIGATLVLGEAYFLGDTPGSIVPKADIGTSGMYSVFIGIADATDKLRVNISAKARADTAVA